MGPAHNTDAGMSDRSDAGKADRGGLFGCAVILFLFLAFDICCACGAMCWILMSYLPLWGALALGIPLGILAAFLWIALFVNAQGGGSIDAMDIVVHQGIIIVFAVILFPVFSQARSKARQTACLHNLHAIGTGLLLYAQDWDDTFPPAARWSDTTAAKLKPEETRTVFRCPEAHSVYSYAFNISLDRLPEPDPLVAAQVVMLFEANVASRNAAGDQTLVAHPPRHYGANEYLFADGHAKPIKSDAAAGLRWTPLP